MFVPANRYRAFLSQIEPRLFNPAKPDLEIPRNPPPHILMVFTTRLCAMAGRNAAAMLHPDNKRVLLR